MLFYSIKKELPVLEYIDRGYMVTYGQRLSGHVSLISHPYGDSSAAYLGTTILTILLFTTIINQYNKVPPTPRCTPL